MSLEGYTQLGTHRADIPTADAIAIGPAVSGLLLGQDPQGRPLALSLFTREPLAVQLVGSLPLAMLLALRATALGADVLLQTDRLQMWQRFVDVVGGPQGAVRPLEPDVVPAAGRPTRPMLVVIDGDGGEVEPDVSQPWLTALTLVDRPTNWNAAALAAGDAQILQTQPQAAARTVAKALGTRTLVDTLSGLGPDEVAVVRRDAVRTCTIAPTAFEDWLIGPISRR